jgi:hypothetical protein
MKLFLLAILSFLLSPCFLFAQTQSDSNYVMKTYDPATGLLYSQDDFGSMQMRCTVTAIEKNKTGYIFATAAHCACEDDEVSRKATPINTFFYVSSDEKGSKSFMEAKLLGCGYQHASDDFALLQVDTDRNIPVISLGTDPAPMEPIVNIASPLGLGKQVFVGNVSSAELNRPVIADEGSINWTGAVLLQLFGTDGGSSGSSVVCRDQQAICAFVVGTIDRTTIVAEPISRMIAFKEKLAAGKYTHWDPNADVISNKSKAKK